MDFNLFPLEILTKVFDLTDPYFVSVLIRVNRGFPIMIRNSVSCFRIPFEHNRVPISWIMSFPYLSRTQGSLFVNNIRELLDISRHPNHSSGNIILTTSLLGDLKNKSRLELGAHFTYIFFLETNNNRLLNDCSFRFDYQNLTGGNNTLIYNGKNLFLDFNSTSDSDYDIPVMVETLFSYLMEHSKFRSLTLTSYTSNLIPIHCAIKALKFPEKLVVQHTSSNDDYLRSSLLTIILLLDMVENLRNIKIIFDSPSRKLFKSVDSIFTQMITSNRKHQITRPLKLKIPIRVSSLPQLFLCYPNLTHISIFSSTMDSLRNLDLPNCVKKVNVYTILPNDGPFYLLNDSRFQYRFIN